MFYKGFSETLDKLGSSPSSVEKIKNLGFAGVAKFLHPLVLFIYMQVTVGKDWEDLEPEVVRGLISKELSKIEDDAQREEIIDRIMEYFGAWGAILNKAPMVSPHAFENIVLAFSKDRHPSFFWDQAPYLYEVSDALNIVDAVAEVDWDYEVDLYIYALCQATDFHYVREEFDFIHEIEKATTWFRKKETKAEQSNRDSESYRLLDSAIDEYIRQRERVVEDYIAMVS